MKIEFYLHLDNGDWNIECANYEDLLGQLDFEVNSCHADKFMVTREPLKEYWLTLERK